MNPKAPGTKRKLEWTGIDDAFGLSKKPRNYKPSELQFGSMLDFPRSTFEQRSPAAASTSKGKGKAPTFSLDTNMSDFSLQVPQEKIYFQSPAGHEVSARLNTPKPPLLPPPLMPKSSTSAKEKNWVSLGDVPVPVLEPAFEPTTSTPKGMQSAFRTPFIPAPLAFTSPPASQELDVPLSQILGSRDMSPKRMSSNELALTRGLAPSPVKGGGSPKKTFIRGGLADRARLFMTRSTTDFSLWYQDVSSITSTISPSLRMCVNEIICQYPCNEPPLLTQSAQGPANFSTVLARCERVDALQGKAHMTTLVLFKSSKLPGALSTEGVRKRVADTSMISVGREVLLWQPWTEIQLSLRIEDMAGSPEVAILCCRFVVK